MGNDRTARQKFSYITRQAKHRQSLPQVPTASIASLSKVFHGLTSKNSIEERSLFTHIQTGTVQPVMLRFSFWQASTAHTGPTFLIHRQAWTSQLWSGFLFDRQVQQIQARFLIHRQACTSQLGSGFLFDRQVQHIQARCLIHRQARRQAIYIYSCADSRQALNNKNIQTLYDFLQIP